MEEQPNRLDLSAAEAALERGDYGQCLELLAPLAEAHPLSDTEGGRLRLLMITAWMGKGDDTSAVTTCRLLCRSRDPELRQQAKRLLEVLESPSLDRPERWSMRLPDLEMNGSGNAAPPMSSRRRSRRPAPPPPPPTGPTRAPTAGFAILVTGVLLALTLLLSGCVRIETDLSSSGPDRLQMHWWIRNDTGRPLPWQTQLESRLHKELPDLTLQHPAPGELELSSPVLPSHRLQEQITRLIAMVEDITGLSLPPPKIEVIERNWLIGIEQRLTMQLDLSTLTGVSDLNVTFTLQNGQIQKTLHGGESNRVEQRIWHWSALGLGSLLVGLLLGLSLLLQDVVSVWASVFLNASDSELQWIGIHRQGDIADQAVPELLPGWKW